MKATFRRGLYGEQKGSIEIEGDALLSIFRKIESDPACPNPDLEHRYLLCWTNEDYRRSGFESPGLLLVSLYLTDAEFRQMMTRLDQEDVRTKEKETEA